MWKVLVTISAISLLIFWRGPNAVWGGITFGIFGGLIAAASIAFLGRGFHWPIVGKGVVIGVLVGVVAELLGKLSDFLRHRS